ncbi:unnamed protein product [Fraxinus pennsylvanica]|uniref:RING-type E3 ubiquitin transferase n=1 Tax=Fraxinus pennsylvanica TaxID=56036 RepID=A0AAD2E627_9LAMI|nr:unnamed protein product [Fraxinus pennsylvanica]
MDGYNQSSQVVHLDITKKGEETITPDDQSISSLQINFDFSCRFSYHLIQLRDLQNVSTEIHPSVTPKSVCISQEKLNSGDEAREIILKALESWPVRDFEREDLIQIVFHRTNEIAKSVSPNRNFVFVHVHVKVSRLRVVDERVIFNRILQQSMEENCKMVPASDSSVESLEKKRLEYDGVESCTICLSEFYQGSEVVTRMPCSHVFHENCIKKWLKTSHYCPVCRFKMPTS